MICRLNFYLTGRQIDHHNGTPARISNLNRENRAARSGFSRRLFMHNE